MFNKIKNLFKNSKRNQLKKLSSIVEELRAENDARASEIYSLKKALQECQDNQANYNDYDVEELQSKCEDLQDTLDNMPDFDDLESRIDDLEYYIEDKADKDDLEELDRVVNGNGDFFSREINEIKEDLESINQLKQIKSDLKTMFQKIVNALED